MNVSSSHTTENVKNRKKQGTPRKTKLGTSVVPASEGKEKNPSWNILSDALTDSQSISIVLRLRMTLYPVLPSQMMKAKLTSVRFELRA